MAHILLLINSHPWRLQFLSSEFSPGQYSDMQSRYRVCTPGPHVFEQLVHDPHELSSVAIVKLFPNTTITVIILVIAFNFKVLRLFQVLLILN